VNGSCRKLETLTKLDLKKLLVWFEETDYEKADVEAE